MLGVFDADFFVQILVLMKPAALLQCQRFRGRVDVGKIHKNLPDRQAGLDSLKPFRAHEKLIYAGFRLGNEALHAKPREVNYLVGLDQFELGFAMVLTNLLQQKMSCRLACQGQERMSGLVGLGDLVLVFVNLNEVVQDRARVMHGVGLAVVAMFFKVNHNLDGDVSVWSRVTIGHNLDGFVCRRHTFVGNTRRACLLVSRRVVKKCFFGSAWGFTPMNSRADSIQVLVFLRCFYILVRPPFRFGGPKVKKKSSQNREFCQKNLRRFVKCLYL